MYKHEICTVHTWRNILRSAQCLTLRRLTLHGVKTPCRQTLRGVKLFYFVSIYKESGVPMLIFRNNFEYFSKTQNLLTLREVWLRAGQHWRWLVVIVDLAWSSLWRWLVIILKVAGRHHVGGWLLSWRWLVIIEEVVGCHHGGGWSSSWRVAGHHHVGGWLS